LTGRSPPSSTRREWSIVKLAAASTAEKEPGARNLYRFPFEIKLLQKNRKKAIRVGQVRP